MESQELTKAQDAYAGAQQKRAEAHGAGNPEGYQRKGMDLQIQGGFTVAA